MLVRPIDLFPTPGTVGGGKRDVRFPMISKIIGPVLNKQTMVYYDSTVYKLQALSVKAELNANADVTGQVKIKKLRIRSEWDRLSK